MKATLTSVAIVETAALLEEVVASMKGGAHERRDGFFSVWVLTCGFEVVAKARRRRPLERAGWCSYPQQCF